MDDFFLFTTCHYLPNFCILTTRTLIMNEASTWMILGMRLNSCHLKQSSLHCSALMLITCITQCVDTERICSKQSDYMIHCGISLWIIHNSMNLPTPLWKVNGTASTTSARTCKLWSLQRMLARYWMCCSIKFMGLSHQKSTW